MRRKSRGQALTEFALVVPIFLIVIFGLIDLGRYVYTANAIANGTREAARIGSVGNRPVECATLSREACAQLVVRSRSWGVPPNVITANVLCGRITTTGSINPLAVSACRTNDLITVQGSTNFTLITPLIAQLVGPLTVAAESSIAVNQ